jgi:hypothetical protein
MEENVEQAQQAKVQPAPGARRATSHAVPWHRQRQGRPPLLLGSVEQLAEAYASTRNESPRQEFCTPPLPVNGDEGSYTDHDAACDLLSLLLYAQGLEQRLEGQAHDESVTLEWLCKAQREAGEWRARYQAKHLELQALLPRNSPPPPEALDDCCQPGQLKLPFDSLPPLEPG